MGGHREFAGNDLEEAIRLAGEAFGVPTERLAYTLLDEGRRGVFGYGARQVRIRVAMEDVEWIRSEMPAAAPPPPSPPPQEPPRPSESREPRESARERRPAPPAAPAVREPKRAVDAPPPKPVEANPEILEALRAVVSRILALMGLGLEVEVHPVEDGCVVRLQGEDRDLLVDGDGEVLGSIEFLLNRMSRRSWPEVGSIRVQCDGFRSTRDREIIELTREVAAQVARTGRSQKLQPMNPYERRLVHMTAREIPGIASTSEGDGFLKRITLEPSRDAE